MVYAYRLSDGSLDFESQRPLDMPFPSTTPPHTTDFLTGSLVPLPEASPEGTLEKIAPFTSEAVAKMLVTKVPTERSAQERSSSTEGARIAVSDGNRDLESRVSNVTQAQLDNLHALLHIPVEILMWAPAYSELFHNSRDDMNKVPFLVFAFECGVRLPLTPLLKQFLSEMPLHPLEVSLTL